MEIFLKPSLEHIVLVKILVILWRQNGVWNSLQYLYSQYMKHDMKKIENRVAEKVAHLPLPELLKEKLSNFIKPIGLEIANWISYHCIKHHLPLDLAVEFFWTPQGTIDRKKTAEVIIKYDGLNIYIRYRLACLYCFENDIVELRNKIPEGKKPYFPPTNIADIDRGRYHQNEMMHHWTDSYEETWSLPISYNQYHFQVCAEDGNKEATYYFLQKLTPTERDESLGERIDYTVHGDFLIFLLSQMNEEQETIFFKKWSSTVLNRFLDWPFQSLFVEIANRMICFLSGSDMLLLMNTFAYKEGNGYKDCNYKKLFGNLLEISSSAIKSHIISNFTHRFNSLHLNLFKDEENLKLLLQDVSHTEKKKLINSENGKYICQNWINDEEWNILEVFILECLPSKDEMMRFKEKFDECCFISNCIAGNKHRWDQLFSLTDEPVYNNNKRECVPDEDNLSKRICCT